MKRKLVIPILSLILGTNAIAAQSHILNQDSSGRLETLHRAQLAELLVSIEMYSRMDAYAYVEALSDQEVIELSESIRSMYNFEAAVGAIAIGRQKY